MRSSIFSSSFLSDFRPRLPRTALWVIVTIVVVELGVRSIPDDVYIVAGGWVGEMEAVHATLRESDRAPSVVVFGSSRVRDNIATTVIARELGVAESTVLNLGLRSGRSWDALRLYRSHRDRLSKSSLLVFAADDFSFNASFQGSPRHSLLATLDERLRYARKELRFPVEITSLERRRIREQMARFRSRLLLDWLLESRSRWRDLRRVALAQLGVRPDRTPQRDENGRLKGRIGAGPEEIEADVLAAEMAGLYASYCIAPHLEAEWDELMIMAREDGVRVAIVHLPYRHHCYDAVLRNHPAEFAMYESTLRNIAAKFTVPLLWMHSPDAWGLEPNDFRDYAHLSLRGSTRLAVSLSRWIREQGLMP